MAKKIAQKDPEQPKKVTGKVSDEQVAAWKKKYDAVHEIFATQNEETFIGYIRQPDRDSIGAAMVFYNDKDTISAGEVFLTNCWLGGSDELRNIDNSMVYCAACVSATGVAEFAISGIKKL